MGDVGIAVQALHNTFANAPQKKERDVPASCYATGAATGSAPTIAAWVGNLSTIDIENVEDGNGGKDFATEMFGKLKAICSGSTCKGIMLR